MKNLIYLFAFLPLFSCMQKNDDSTMNDRNKTAYNEQRMADFYRMVINAHNPAMIDSFCTVDYVEHSPFPGYPSNIDGLKKGFSDMMSAFPDMTAEVQFVKAFGDTVMAMFKMKGTNTGMFMGAPATNKSFEVNGVDIVLIKDGKATEHWGFSEEMKMMTQLGMGRPEAVPEAKKD